MPTPIKLDSEKFTSRSFLKIILITGTEVRASSQKSLWDVGLKKRKEQLLILVFLPAMVIITSVILLSGCTRIMFSV